MPYTELTDKLFITEMGSVYREVRTGSLKKKRLHSVLKGLRKSVSILGIYEFRLIPAINTDYFPICKNRFSLLCSIDALYSLHSDFSFQIMKLWFYIHR